MRQKRDKFQVENATEREETKPSLAKANRPFLVPRYRPIVSLISLCLCVPPVLRLTGRHAEIYGASKAASENDVRAQRLCGEDPRGGGHRLPSTTCMPINRRVGFAITAASSSRFGHAGWVWQDTFLRRAPPSNMGFSGVPCSTQQSAG